MEVFFNKISHIKRFLNRITH